MAVDNIDSKLVISKGQAMEAKRGNISRAELIERLKQLAESEPPKNLSLGAMCYVPAPSSTIQQLFSRIGYQQRLIRKYKVPLKRIQGLGIDAKLIIPKHVEKENFQLEIKYPDQSDSVRIELESAVDLEHMALFLQGKDRYEAGRGRETALKDKVDRLIELFRVENNRDVILQNEVETDELKLQRIWRKEYEIED